MSSQRKQKLLMAKLIREEAVKEEQAAMRIAKQNYETTVLKKHRKKQLEQMAFQELEDGHRQCGAAAELNEAELMEIRSLFSHHSSEVSLLKKADQRDVRICSVIGIFVFIR